MAARSTRDYPERIVQVSLVKWLAAVLPQGSLVFAVKNEHATKSNDAISRMRFHQKRKAEGVKAGFPDLGVCLPGGRAVFIEVKAPGEGVVSDTQQRVHEELLTIGHDVGVADSIESARRVLLGAGVKLREAAGQLLAEPKVHRAKRRASLNDALPF